MDVEKYYWIGYVRPEDARPTVAFITPLAYFNEQWQVIGQNTRRELFPNNGKVTIFKDFPGTLTEQIWMFHPEKNVRAEDLPKNSHYMVEDVIEPEKFAQIIDWKSRANHSYKLVDLLEEGIPAKDCFCKNVYISFQSYLYGPIRLELDSDRFKPREYLPSLSTGGQPLFVCRYTLPEDGFLDLTQAHPQFTFLDERMLDTPTGKEDWSLPQVVIKRVMQASNDALAGTEENVRLVDKRLRDLARLNSRDGPAALHLDPIIIKRAQYIVSNQVERLKDLHEFFEQLHTEHPLMKAAREWAILKRSHEIEQQIEALAQKKQERLLQLQGNIEEAETKLEQLRIATVEAGQRYDQAVESFNMFERNMQERMTTLKEEPTRVLAELRSSASLLPLLMNESRQLSNESMIQLASPPVNGGSEQRLTPSESGLNWRTTGATLANNAELQKLQAKYWVQAAQQVGVNPTDVRKCAATLLAGLIPALEGEEAISTLKAVAQIIAFGRIAVIPVPLTALTPLDLFGTVDAQRQKFIPAVGGLADYILQAQQHPGELLLIVLEGIDRVPGPAVYVPLLRQYMEIRQAGVDVTPINLFHPLAITPDDPYFKLAWFTWPRNVLLALTCDDDMNSLPLPSACNRWLVRFKAVGSQKASAPAKKSSLLFSDTSLHWWQAWEEDVRSQTTMNADLQELLDYRQQAFYAALTALHVKDPDKVVENIWPEQFEQESKEID